MKVKERLIQVLLSPLTCYRALILRFACNHVNWTVNDWKRPSDKTRVSLIFHQSLSYGKGMVKYFEKPASPSQDAFEGGGGSEMFWNSMTLAQNLW